MLRGVVGVLAVLAALAASAVGNPPPAQPQGDLGLLQGNWKPLQCEYQGQPQMPADVMKQVTVVFDNAEYHLYFVDHVKGEPKVLKLAVANVTLDPGATPKGITFEFADGPLKGQKRHGIYEIAGNQLKLCYGPVEKPRPAAFAAPAGSGYFFEIWAKQPPK